MHINPLHNCCQLKKRLFTYKTASCMCTPAMDWRLCSCQPRRERRQANRNDSSFMNHAMEDWKRLVAHPRPLPRPMPFSSPWSFNMSPPKCWYPPMPPRPSPLPNAPRCPLLYGSRCLGASSPPIQPPCICNCVQIASVTSAHTGSYLLIARQSNKDFQRPAHIH